MSLFKTVPISASAILFLLATLTFSCSEEQKKPEPVIPAEKMTTQDGLNPVNKTRDYTLYANFKEGKVMGWEVHDKEGNPLETVFEKGAINNSGLVKCQVCITQANEEEEDTRKCWEIPCDTMPEE
ncbi:MAG: hypothetical protein DWQ02_16385 [Bacteroidetes bacterium]|nr:MAG: hypothetical protein DWQ02_16385 [Bacteroidota bacterium]